MHKLIRDDNGFITLYSEYSNDGLDCPITAASGIGASCSPSWCALFHVEDELWNTSMDNWTIALEGKPTGRKLVTLCNGRQIVCEVE